MSTDIYKYHFIKEDPRGDWLKELELKLDCISLQNIDDKYFTIIPSNPKEQTYLKLERREGYVQLWIRTQRAPNHQGGLNLEPSLEEILDEAGIEY